MRYEDWDVLLFPYGSKIPFQEFKVNCYAVHDTEFVVSGGSFAIPTVSCFVPTLPPGEPFQVSIHSWTAPMFDQSMYSIAKMKGTATFEARVFIDGSLCSSTPFANAKQICSFPIVLQNPLSLANGRAPPLLEFPHFRSEVQQQSYWSPADDIGRIKVVISEGYITPVGAPRVERIRNVVAFSFQHAPIKFLESAGIAWPNNKMWKEIKVASSAVDYSDTHAPSPPRKARALPLPDTSWMESQSTGAKSTSEGQDWMDQYHSTVEIAGITVPHYQGHSRKPASDFSIPECSPSGYKDYPWDFCRGPEAPKNTPQSAKDGPSMSTVFDDTYINLSLLNQPSPDHAGKLKSVPFPPLPNHTFYVAQKIDAEAGTPGDSCTPPEFSYLSMVRQPASTPANNLAQKASQAHQATPNKVLSNSPGEYLEQDQEHESRRARGSPCKVSDSTNDKLRYRANRLMLRSKGEASEASGRDESC